MINKAIFKAYDIRGRYPAEINEQAVMEIVSKIAGRFRLKTVVVGHDARLSSIPLYKAVLKALKTSNSKLKTIEAGMITTPSLYFLVNKLDAAGGMIITASHNPKEYNGLKIVGPRAEPISGEEIKKWII